jgi:restriction system protein
MKSGSANNLPRYSEYVYPTLQVIKERGGSATIEEIEDGVAERMRLSDEVLSIPHGETGRTEFQYKLAWVRTYLKKYGAVVNSERGVWAITDLGERLTEQEASNVFKSIHAQRTEKKQKDARVLEEGCRTY